MSVVLQARAAFKQVLPGIDMLGLEARTLDGDDSDEDAIEALDGALNQLLPAQEVENTD